MKLRRDEIEVLKILNARVLIYQDRANGPGRYEAKKYAGKLVALKTIMRLFRFGMIDLRVDTEADASKYGITKQGRDAIKAILKEAYTCPQPTQSN